MGLRETLGGQLEAALDAAVDKNLSAEMLTPLVLDLLNKQLEGIKHKIKADIIDLIDGEDDIK